MALLRLLLLDLRANFLTFFLYLDTYLQILNSGSFVEHFRCKMSFCTFTLLFTVVHYRDLNYAMNF